MYAFSKMFASNLLANDVQQDGALTGAYKTLLATHYQLEETFHTIAPCPVKREMENRKMNFSSVAGEIS